jgi:hypothetical protein
VKRFDFSSQRGRGRGSPCQAMFGVLAMEEASYAPPGASCDAPRQCAAILSASRRLSRDEP